MDEAIAAIDRAARGHRPYPVLVTNANKAWLARRDPRLADILDRAPLVLPEYGIEWAARRLGIEGIRHARGVAVMDRLLDLATAGGHTVYLLGASEDVVAALADRLRRERPGLKLVGWKNGYLDTAEWEALVAELVRLRPQFLFVAMGSPLQEYRIDELVRRVPTLRVAMGVGGSFDVLSGAKKDAPSWLRGNGLEWIYRTAQEPRRLLKRYLVVNTWFIARVFRERWRR